MNPKKIIIALDGMSSAKALRIAKKLNGYVWGFKVNDLLFDNPKIIRQLKRYGNVFADAKLHDIPNTVANSVRKLAKLGADIITVHASGGKEMMKAAKLAAGKPRTTFMMNESRKVVRGKSKIIAVTILTSQKISSLKKVIELTHDAIAAGVDGIVCSGHELSVLKKIKGIGDRVIIVPGVRPSWYMKKDDQKRAMTPRKAISLGADYVVIGRPITESKDPLFALRKL